MQTIFELIQQGENASIEFKEQSVHADSIAKETVAMLNTSGGSILIGMSDDGKVLDIDKAK